MTRRPDFAEELARIEAKGLLRSMHARPAVGGAFLDGGRRILNFSSNDYLDLAGHVAVKAASVRAVETLGCGATASRLMTGTLEIHAQLEARLASMAGAEAALVFGSGFLTNAGILSAIADRNAVIFSDRLNHASILDGALLSRARLQRYRHADAGHLASLLAGCHAARRIVVTDSVFSMDGDLAPLKSIAALCRAHDALLVVDEAHAIGVFGEQGGGLCRATEPIRADLVIGTLSKALGGYGGFAACTAALRRFLINKARSFIYSTALPPACAGAALGALGVLSEHPDMGAALLARAECFRRLLAAAGFATGHSASHIIPLVVGRSEDALAFSEALSAQGILAVAVRPPTVPAGTARLRLSVTLAHGMEDLRRAADILKDTARGLGLL